MLFKIRLLLRYDDYLKPTAACQTKARSKKNTGIAGITSTIGRNAVYGSGRAANKKFISIRITNFNYKKTKLNLIIQ